MFQSPIFSDSLPCRWPSFLAVVAIAPGEKDENESEEKLPRKKNFPFFVPLSFGQNWKIVLSVGGAREFVRNYSFSGGNFA